MLAGVLLYVFKVSMLLVGLLGIAANRLVVPPCLYDDHY